MFFNQISYHLAARTDKIYVVTREIKRLRGSYEKGGTLMEFILVYRIDNSKIIRRDLKAEFAKHEEAIIRTILELLIQILPFYSYKQIPGRSAPGAGLSPAPQFQFLFQTAPYQQL